MLLCTALHCTATLTLHNDVQNASGCFGGDEVLEEEMRYLDADFSKYFVSKLVHHYKYVKGCRGGNRDASSCRANPFCDIVSLRILTSFSYPTTRETTHQGCVIDITTGRWED